MSEVAQERLLRSIWAAGQSDAIQELAALGLAGVGTHGLSRCLDAYREHAKALSVRALAAAYPRVQLWLGEADFAGLAWAFARQHPPREGDLARWGAELPVVLEALPGMEPELPALARLDWSLHTLGWQPDECVQPELLEGLQAGGEAGLRLSQSLRLLILPASALPVAESAAPAQWPDPAPLGADYEREVLVWRRGWQPCWAVLAPGWWHFLTCLQAGQGLGAAIESSLAQAPDFDAGQILHRALSEGWILATQP